MPQLWIVGVVEETAMASLTKELMTKRIRRDQKLLVERQKKEKIRTRQFQAKNKEVLELIGIQVGASVARNA